MKQRRSSWATTSVATLAICLLSLFIGCDDENDPPGFSISGKGFTYSFDDVGPVALEADTTVGAETNEHLFDRLPSEAPPTAQLTLPSTSVAFSQVLTEGTVSDSGTPSQAGTATIRLLVAEGHSVSSSDSAVLLAEFEVILTMGIAAILDEVYDLSQEAIAVLMTNDVTIFIEVTSNVDGEITIGEYYLTFGGGQAGSQPPRAPSGLPAVGGAWTQVPIDSRAGKAVPTPINLSVAGVSYGVIGVLEAKTPDVSNPLGEPSTITVDPAELNLVSVYTLHIGTHSAYIPDMEDNVTIATLTVDYSDGGPPTTLDFVTGTNTAEWSYDREEHISSYGGVVHEQAPVLYTFETAVGSSSAYTGSVYSASMRVDPSRTISSLTLSMAEPESFDTARMETGYFATWAAQALTAITFEGRVAAIPEERACCFSDESCNELEPAECLAAEGRPRLDRRSCATTDCTTEDDGEPEVCCLPPSVGYEFDPSVGIFEQVCRDIGEPPIETRSICEFFDGEPRAPGTTCEDFECDSDFIACCDLPPGNPTGCNEMTYDVCTERGGDPQPFGVHCHEHPCDWACCDQDGMCEEMQPDTCTDGGGIPGPPGYQCDLHPCLGACCEAGTCFQATGVECEAFGGDWRGLDVDCADVDCGSTGDGGCCYGDNLFCYINVDAMDCIDAGGEPQASCVPEPCLFPCCQTGGECTVGLTLDECEADFGTVHDRGLTCDDVTCDSPRWVLVDTLINPYDALTEFIAGVTPDWFTEDRFAGKMATYTVTSTSISWHDVDVDHGYTSWDITLTSTFEEPPAEMNPGDTVSLNVTFSHSGTVDSGSPGARFWYSGDGVTMDTPDTLPYFPWDAGFTGIDSATYTFTVPPVSGAQIEIYASWWNCPACLVTWVYESN